VATARSSASGQVQVRERAATLSGPTHTSGSGADAPRGRPHVRPTADFCDGAASGSELRGTTSVGDGVRLGGGQVQPRNGSGRNRRSRAAPASRWRPPPGAGTRFAVAAATAGTPADAARASANCRTWPGHLVLGRTAARS